MVEPEDRRAADPRAAPSDELSAFVEAACKQARAEAAELMMGTVKGEGERADRAEAERDRLRAESLEDSAESVRLLARAEKAEGRVAELADLLTHLRQDIPHHDCTSDACQACAIDTALGAEQPAPRRECDDVIACPYCNKERLDPECSYCAGSGKVAL